MQCPTFLSERTYSAKDSGNIAGPHNDTNHGVLDPNMAAHFCDGRENEVVVGHVQPRIDAVQKQACGSGDGILVRRRFLKDTSLHIAALML